MTQSDSGSIGGPQAKQARSNLTRDYSELIFFINLIQIKCVISEVSSQFEACIDSCT